MRILSDGTELPRPPTTLDRMKLPTIEEDGFLLEPQHVSQFYEDWAAMRFPRSGRQESA